MASDLSEGDVVQLKSGGPEMTVDALNVGMEKNVRCKWFKGTEAKTEVFDEEALKKVSD